MRPIVAALLLAACSAAGERQTFTSEFPPPAGRALGLEDYYRIKDVGAPRISPDARWVAYTVSLPDERSNETKTESWIVRADGSAPPRRIQHQGTDVSNPRWTDDGLLRYTAGRASWTLDVNRPAARPSRAPDEDDGIASPDGRWVARLRDAPRDSTPVEMSDFERRHEARFKGVQFDWLGFQRDGAPFPAPDLTARPAQEIVLQPAKGGEERKLTDLGLRPGDLTWHPGSGLLAFTADAEWRDERSYADPDLYIVTLEGNVTRLTSDGYNHGSLAFSPDGRWLSYTRTFGTDMIIEQRLNHGGPRDLFVRAMGGEENGNGTQPINLTASWDLEPQQPRWSPDSRYLYFTAETGGAEHLFRVAAGGGEVEQLTRGERRLNGVSFDRDLTTIAYTVGRFEMPDEIYAASIDGSNERKLTSVHEEIAREITFSEAERLLYRSRDGTRVEGWLLYPYGYRPGAGPYPMIVHSHGGPHSASGYGFNFKHQLFAAHGFFVLQTNFRSSTGYGDAFKWATWGAWGDKDGEDVMAGVDYAIANFPIDRNRVGSIGHSYGGFMTNWLIARYPDRFAAAASGAGISNWVSDYGTADIARTKETEFFGTPWMTEARNRMIRQSPLTYAGQVRTPTLFVHGEVDQRVPYEEAEQMYVALKKNGVPAKVIQYQGQAHGIRGAWNNVHRAMHELRWFETYLKD